MVGLAPEVIVERRTPYGWSVTTLLLDASVLLATFDPEDDHHAPARTLLEDVETTLATLDLVRYEIANVTVRA